jgi:L-amino acid N-acyltransferase YncA
LALTAATVRDARSADLPAIAAIYGAAADSTPATFDFSGQPPEWWQATLEACDQSAGRLLLVAVEGDTVLGFAKSGSFKEKRAYDTTCETSVYIDADHRGRGVGNALYRELLARLDASGLRLAVAGITQPNDASNRLHRAHGFTEVGTFSEVGVKLGRSWDVTWVQRPLRGAAPLSGQ